MATNVLEALSISVGMDTAKFDKGIKRTNTELGKTARLGTQLDKALKVDPTNIELLNNKLTTTSKELKDTESKAESLKKQIKLMSEASGEIDEAKLLEYKAELVKTEVNVKRLTTQQQNLNKDIKAIDTGKFDELTNKTKRAAIQTGDLTTEQVGWSEAINETNLDSYIEQIGEVAGGTNEFGGSIVGAMQKLGPYGTLVGSIASGALALYFDNSQKAAEANLEFAGNANIAASDVDDFRIAASEAGASLGLDYSTSIEIANRATNTFDDSIRTLSDDMRSIQIADIAEIDDSQLISLKNIVYELGGSATDVDKLSASINTFKNEYGDIAQDLPDAIIEFQDEIIRANPTLDGFFNSIKRGYESGAESTTQILDAQKEFEIQMREGSDDVKAALGGLNLSYDDVLTTISQEGYPAAMYQVLNSANDITSAAPDTKKGLDEINTAVTNLGTVFGETPTEDWLGPLVRDGELLPQTAKNMSGYAIAQAIATQGQYSFRDSLMANKEELGLTETQVNELANKYGGLGVIQQLLALQSQGVLLPALLQNKDALGLTKEQATNAANSFQAVVDNGGKLNGLTREQLTPAVQFLTETFGLNEQQTDGLWSAWNIANGNLLDLNGTVLTAQGLNEGLTGKLKDLSKSEELNAGQTKMVTNGIEQMNDKTLTADKRATGFKNALSTLRDKGLIPADTDIGTLTNSYRTFADENSTVEEKTQAFRDAVEELNEQNMLSPELYDDVIAAMDDQDRSLESAKDKFGDVTDSTKDSADQLKDMNDKLDDSTSSWDDLKISIGNAVTKLGDWNAKDVKNKTATFTITEKYNEAPNKPAGANIKPSSIGLSQPYATAARQAQAPNTSAAMHSTRGMHSSLNKTIINAGDLNATISANFNAIDQYTDMELAQKVARPLRTIYGKERRR